MVDPQLKSRPSTPSTDGPHLIGESFELGFDLRTLVDETAARPADPTRTLDAPPRYDALVAASGHVTRAGYCSALDGLAEAARVEPADTIYEPDPPAALPQVRPPAALPQVSAPRPHAVPGLAMPRPSLHALVLDEPRRAMSPEIVRYALLVALLAVVGTAAGTALGLLFRAI